MEDPLSGLLPDNLPDLMHDRPILAYEDPDKYDVHLAQLLKSFELRDVLDYYLVKEVADTQWWINLMRRMRATCMRLAEQDVLQDFLTRHAVEAAAIEGPRDDQEDDPRTSIIILMQGVARGDPHATFALDQAMRHAGLTFEKVTEEAYHKATPTLTFLWELQEELERRMDHIMRLIPDRQRRMDAHVKGLRLEQARLSSHAKGVARETRRIQKVMEGEGSIEVKSSNRQTHGIFTRARRQARIYEAQDVAQGLAGRFSDAYPIMCKAVSLADALLSLSDARQALLSLLTSSGQEEGDIACAVIGDDHDAMTLKRLESAGKDIRIRMDHMRKVSGVVVKAINALDYLMVEEMRKQAEEARRIKALSGKFDLFD